VEPLPQEQQRRVGVFSSANSFDFGISQKPICSEA
jgi:hypothetical protein